MAAKETKKELRVEIAHGVGGILLGRAWVDGREVPFVQHESNGVYFIGTADLDASVPNQNRKSRPMLRRR
jgi:hypothetical protein